MKKIILLFLAILMPFLAISFNLIGSNNINMYIMRDGAFLITDKEIYLSEKPDEIIGRYSIKEKEDIENLRVKFVWNNKELTGTLVKENNIIYIKGDDGFYYPFSSNIAYEKLPKPTYKIVPDGPIMYLNNNLGWEGNHILVFNKDKSILEIGYKIYNKNNFVIKGAAILIDSNINRFRFNSYFKALEFRAAETDQITQYQGLLSRVSYKAQIDLSPMEEKSIWIDQYQLDVNKTSYISPSIFYKTKSNPTINLIFKAPADIPSGKISIVEEDGSPASIMTLPTHTKNQEVVLNLFPNQYIEYEYSPTLTHSYRNNIYKVEMLKYDLIITNYNNVSESAYIEINIPSDYEVENHIGDLNLNKDKLTKILNLSAGQTITLSGKISFK